MKKRTMLIWALVIILLVVPMVNNTEEVVSAVSAPFVKIAEFFIAVVNALAVVASTWLGIFS